MASDAERVAANVWRRRQRFEMEAAARFEQLAVALASHGAQATVVAMAEEAAHDERRHAALCGELVQHYGGEATSVPSVAPRAVSPRQLTPREQLLYEVVAMCCVTETLSSALLGTLVEQADDSLTLRSMRTILRDEVQHSRLGWAHLAAERQRGVNDVIGPFLPAILAGTVAEEVFSDEPEHPLQDALGARGALSRADRLRVFDETMRQVVFPGLRRFRIDTQTGETWLAERT